MDYISIKKFKFYTKETLKFLNIALIAIGFIIAIILIKYKPMYEVKISGEEVGYINNKKALNESIKNNIENYSNKNVENVKLTTTPEYELKLVERTQQDNESDVIIALQNELEITYKYYEIAYNGKAIESVADKETAEKLVEDIKEVSNQNVELEISEKTTNNEKDLNANTLEVAKENIIEKLDIKTNTENEITQINGIKIATLPVSGTISSRYGASSKIRVSTHTGLDIAASTGTPIKAAASGTVVFAGTKGSYGRMVIISHGNGVQTYYGHCSSLDVSVGQTVSQGQVIAKMGSTGNSTGSHLHLEIRVNGSSVNPQKYLY